MIKDTADRCLPRPEYPRPQMVRDEWLNLNGCWYFEIDHGKSGRDRELHLADKLSREIIVPFCPESELSGINYKDFMSMVWYKRSFELPESWEGKRILLHFGAVDYEAEIWINGKFVGKHVGGYSSFSFDITSFLQSGTNIITVCAEDELRSETQPRGKQSNYYYSMGCLYTRVTGIWQTVWLECVPEQYIKGIKIITEPENNIVYIDADLSGDVYGYNVEFVTYFNGKKTGSKTVNAAGNVVKAAIELSETHLWEAGKPNLYDLEIKLYKNGTCIDKIRSYFGMRSIAIDKENMVVLINGKPVFQRLVLDQGYYPDGIYTAPSDEALKRDIEISLAAGFNGARLHQKVFEPRFLYWADKLGYLVWGEQGSWGLDISTPQGLKRFLPEWTEIIERDFNHPSLIGWCPFNETYHNGVKSSPFGDHNLTLSIIYNMTKTIDPTRPVIDTSGFFHAVTDIYDIHDYEDDPEKMTERYEQFSKDGVLHDKFSPRQQYEGQPVFISEYGGIWWLIDKEINLPDLWRSRLVNTEEEFVERYRGLTRALLRCPKVFAFCYTQLYDVEQEMNGIYTYDRKPKLNPEIIKKINTETAAIEE